MAKMTHPTPSPRWMVLQYHGFQTIINQLDKNQRYDHNYYYHQ